jgi:transcriptional accessory protein Tex/SPT6
MSEAEKRTVEAVAEELDLEVEAVGATVTLLSEGKTVAFIARNRRERTGGLDESQVRAVQREHEKRIELEERRTTILNTISTQDKLTPELEARIRAARTRDELEDLYLPYKPRLDTGGCPTEGRAAPERRDGRAIDDLHEGMEVDGVVTNLKEYGAFVDVGAERNGLVHISELTDRFVRDVSEVVKVGDRIRVRVIAVDTARGRISLSARRDGRADERDRPRRAGGEKQPEHGRRDRKDEKERRKPGTYNPFAEALQKKR